MSDARGDILDRIRRGLRRGPLGEAQAGALMAQLATPQRNLIPARATRLDHRAQVDLFVAMAEEVHTTTARVTASGEVPAAVAEYLAQHNLPAFLVMTPDARLDDISWAELPTLTLRRGVATPEDAVGLSACFAGIAETGTLMLYSGPASPTTNNFLPETHIVVLRASQVVATYEDAWTRLRDERRRADGGFTLPRTVNFITGPSRTGDIEQRLELGAHGPRRLHIIIVDDGESSPRDVQAPA